jgi:phenylalanyl-tRNA synthetase alpha chain
MQLAEHIAQIRAEFQQDCAALKLADQAVEELRIKYLGKKGRITTLFTTLAELPATEKPLAGKLLNELKRDVESTINQLKEQLLTRKSDEEFFDYTLPGISPKIGHFHPVTQTINHAINIFREMGFDVRFGPEVETDYYNFGALNFPPDHPARDMQDTFFITEKILLRTHTSPIQIRTMLNEKPPIRILAPGRVYRNEAINPRSYCTFHQIEGLYVDREVSFSELKTTLVVFAKRFFGTEAQIRFRPSFFPFTEPSAELDVTCIICGGTGCRVCKQSGWLEILGCGMVDPNVLQEVGIDPEIYSGYAFGMGLDRIALLKYGITDIRLLFDGDIRFLEQF